MNLRRLLCICCAALLSTVAAMPALASGTTANVTWTNPTQYDDGITTLAPADIAYATVKACMVSSASTCIVQQVKATLAGTPAVSTPPTSASVAGLVCGSYNITVTVTTSTTAHFPNGTSAPGGVAYATGVTCSVPKAVTAVAAS